MDRTVTRAAPTLVVLALALVGCGGGSDEASDPMPTARYAIPSATSGPAPTSSAPSPSVTDAAASEPVEDTPAVRAAFTRGMAAYCTSYYSLLAETEETYPELDAASDAAFEGAAAEASAEAERLLADLRPPPDLTRPFTSFTKLSHQITAAHSAMAQSFVDTREPGPGGADYDRAIVARRPLATALHAPICDGKLPPAQEAAVIDAVRKVETSRDSGEVCRDRVTPGFLSYTFSSFADPVLACAATRAFVDLPSDIDVDRVTGADGIAATVDYTYIGGCACGSNAQARLHFVAGAWLVSSISN